MSTIKHSFVSVVPDSPDPNEVQGSHWNAPHLIDPPVTGLITGDGSGNISALQVKGLLYDPTGAGTIEGLHTVGLLQDKIGDGTITPVRVRGLLNDAAGDGNIAGVQHRGLLIDKAGNGIYSGVDVAGVLVNPTGNNDYVGVTSSAEGMVLRRKYNSVSPAYEFASINRVVSTDFIFNIVPAAPALVVGVNTVTLSYLPTGINESSPNRHSMILGDLAGNEIVLITAVNVATKSITFSCLLPHAAGNWALASASSGIQEAINSAHGTGKGIQVYIPAGLHPIWSTIYIPNASLSPVALVGAGSWVTQITRAAGFTDKPVFKYDPLFWGPTPTKFTVIGLKILNGQNESLAYMTTTEDAFLLQGANCVINEVDITNGRGGITIQGGSSIHLERVTFVQEAAFTPIQQSSYGVHIFGTGNITVNISNCGFIGRDQVHANYMLYGMLVKGVINLWVSNTIISAKTGVSVEGGNSQTIANLHFNSCSLDLCTSFAFIVSGVNAPSQFINVKISNCRIYGNQVVTQTNGIDVRGDVDYINISNNTVFGFGWCGIYVEGRNNFEGVPRRSVIVYGNDVYGNNTGNFADGSGFRSTGPLTGLVLNANTLTVRPGFGHHKYGFFIDNLDASVITGNKISNSEIGPAAVNAYGAAVVIDANSGINNVTQVIPAAATITISLNSLIAISGPTAISRILGGWAGRAVTFIFTDAAPGGFSNLGAGPGNILTNYTVVQYKTVTLTYDGSTWL